MRKLFVVVLCAAAASVLTAGQATAGVSCHKIDATGVGQDLGGGSTVADITNGGLLNGTTAGSFVPTGLSGTIVSIAGTVTFTTNKATLTVTITGSVDLATGAFAASGPVTSSTGKLAGATGALSFAGVENLGTGAFTETVTGNICVDVSG